jgi:hypothetical protein
LADPHACADARVRSPRQLVHGTAATQLLIPQQTSISFRDERGIPLHYRDRLAGLQVRDLDFHAA